MPQRTEPKEIKPAAQRVKYVKDYTAELIVQTTLQYIDDYGWIKGRSGSKVGGFCISGALREAQKDLRPERGKWSMSVETATQKSWDLIAGCIRKVFPRRRNAHLGIVAFNDSSTTKLDDVRAALQCAVDEAKPKKEEPANA